MEIFYSDSISAGSLTLTADDSLHCARVLRHKAGDTINVIDGEGTMYECTVTSDNPKMVMADIIASHNGWHSHPYKLTMAVCPTKNNERFEWFVEKATEIGLDGIAPLIGERSERKVYKTERAAKLVLSATKQSLKAQLPDVCEPVSVKDFLCKERRGVKFIACCFEDESHPRISLRDALAQTDSSEITVLIGPEGDFSPSELRLALEKGYIPVHLGESRLRTETAALVSVSTVYTFYL